MTLLRSLAVAALIGAALPAWSGDVYVIANLPLELTPEEVKEVFLGEVQFAGALKLQPVDNAGAQPDFVAKVLKMSSTKTKKAFRDGLNAPPLKATDAEVLGFVKANPGAIGYVSSPPAGVHVVGKF
ncbi:MAG: phosphate ABC transporter substrate-binding protein [Betaproteobacteria bacterium]|nr:MAG: phosphate ABC transporter substrate-binding protein [Betaproteobacteria bacterium]